MPKLPLIEKSKPLSRRQFLKLGLAGTGVIGGAIAAHSLTSKSRRTGPSVQVPPLTRDPAAENGISPMAVLRDFDYGTVKQEQGRTIREFRITAGNSTLELNSAVTFNSWNFNNRVPGPTLRATQGDRVRVIFLNQGGHSHTLHFHGIHPAAVDGIRPVRNDAATIYEFDAEPYGVQLYHCHIAPVTRHIGKGLYGMFIIDPPEARPPADELVLVMAGYDVDEDQRNELYAFNGLPDYYMMHPIPIYQNQLIRLYVLNMIELDPVATFHLHANFLMFTPRG